MSIQINSNNIIQLQNLPKEMTQLYIYNIELDELPDLSSYNYLTSIICISIGLKRILNLPSSLKLLMISNNCIVYLPDLSHCIHLEYLNCRDNELKELPDLSQCINLNRLYCDQNYLTELPNINVSHLISLSCYNNPFYNDKLRNISQILTFDGIKSLIDDELIGYNNNFILK